MNLPQKKKREIIFLLLFAQAQGLTDTRATEELVMEQLKVSRSNIVSCWEIVNKMIDQFPKLDQIIHDLVKSYEFERIQSVEKTALRLGAYELYYQPELPPQIVIAESLRLTKKFGTPAAVSFVNALMDSLYKLKQGEKLN